MPSVGRRLVDPDIGQCLRVGEHRCQSELADRRGSRAPGTGESLVTPDQIEGEIIDSHAHHVDPGGTAIDDRFEVRSAPGVGEDHVSRKTMGNLCIRVDPDFGETWKRKDLLGKVHAEIVDDCDIHGGDPTL